MSDVQGVFAFQQLTVTLEEVKPLKQSKKMKRAAAVTAAFLLSVGMFSGYAEDVPAEETGQEQQQGFDPENDSFEYQSSDDNSDTDSEEKDDPNPSTALDVTPYASRLREIGEAQKELDEQIQAAEKGLADEEELRKAVMEKLGMIKAKTGVLNAYMTRLEISIKDNEKAISDKQAEIDDSIERFKRRLRALYIAGGEESYLNVLLSSSDFFDVLMRVELVKRVAEHDDRFISQLKENKQELEKLKTELSARKSDYNKQKNELAAQQKAYEELIAQHQEITEELEAERRELLEENKAYIDERKAFEADLSGLLKSDFSDSGSDAARQATELEASAALENLHNSITARIEAGEELPEDECRYVFEWPCPGVYYISYGVGARWGRYHQGIDISGDKYDDVVASESGTVVRTNTSCPHDYGKQESCGCGGGYGNYIIIDHGNGFLTLYGHLTEVNVEPGDKVKQGQHIGYMGSTGFSTGDHLHFEIRYNGMYLNPAAFVVIDKQE